MVFIFCGNVEHHFSWAKEYEKIKAVEMNFDNIKDYLGSFYRISCFSDEVYKNAFHFKSHEAMIEYVNIDFIIKLAD